VLNNGATSPGDASSASEASELSTVISLPSPFTELEVTETSAPEAETESYPDREMYESGSCDRSSSMSSDGSPMTPEEAMRAAGVDSCYNVASSDGSFALQNAGSVSSVHSSSSESCSREGSRADSLPLSLPSLPLPESAGRLLAEPYFVFGGGAQEAVHVHGGTGIDMLQPRKFDEHVYNAVPRAERGHDVAAPPPTSPDDIDIVAGGMGALALDDRVSVTNPAGTNSMRDDAPQAPAPTNSMGDDAPQASAGASKSEKAKDAKDFTEEEWEQMFNPRRCCGARITSSTGLACVAFWVAMWTGPLEA